MDNITRRVTSNFTWLLISDFLSKGAMFLGTLYIARVLEAAEFGLFSFALVVSNYMWVATDLGVSQYGTREVARSPDRAEEILRLLNSLRFLASILIFIALFLVLTIADVSPHKRSVLLAAGLYAIAYALSPDWLLRGAETMKYLAIGNLVMGFTFLSSIFFLVKAPEDTIWAAFLWSFSFFLGSVVMIYLLWRRLGIKFFLTFSLSKWKEHLKESVYFAIIGSLLRVYGYIPLFLLGFLVAPEQLGIFSAPHRLVITLLTFNFVVPRAFYPVLASLHQNPEAFRKANENYRRIMVAIGLPIGVGGTILAGHIIHILYGSSYIEGTNILKILIWQVPIGYMILTYGNPLSVLGLQRPYALALGAGVLITVILNLVLIPIYGTYGAAFAASAGAGIILLFLIFIFSARAYRSIPFDTYFLKVCIACVFMGVIIKIIDVNIVIRLVLGALSYGVIAMALGITKRKDILGFYSIISNRKKG